MVALVASRKHEEMVFLSLSTYIAVTFKRSSFVCSKGQLILKANCQAMNSSKKQMNEFVFSTNSVTCNFFPSETLTGCPFFSLTFGIGEHTKHCSMSFLYSSTRNDMLQCFVCSPIPKVIEKKRQPVRVSIGKKLQLAELVL